MVRRTDVTVVPLAPDVWLHESRTIEDGRIVKFRIQILLHRADARPQQVARYDSAHGRPHVHRPSGFPGRWEPVPASTVEEALALCEEDLYMNIDEYVRLARQRRPREDL